MPDRNVRLLLWAASGGCMVIAVGIFMAAMVVPTEVSGERPELLVASPKAQSSSSSAAPELGEEDFKYVWGKTLQRPVVDPPPPVEKVKRKTATRPVKPAPPPVQLQVKLVGTLIDSDSGYARAWVELKGKLQVVSLGDELTGHPGKPRVERIEDRSIDVGLAGQTHTLVIADTSLSVVDPDPKRGNGGQRGN